MKILPVGTE